MEFLGRVLKHFFPETTYSGPQDGGSVTVRLAETPWDKLLQLLLGEIVTWYMCFVFVFVFLMKLIWVMRCLS